VPRPTHRFDEPGKLVPYGAGEFGESVKGENADDSPFVGEGMSAAMLLGMSSTRVVRQLIHRLGGGLV